MLEVNIVMTSVLAIYAVIIHISLIKLKIHILKLLEAIKKHERGMEQDSRTHDKMGLNLRRKLKGGMFIPFLG